jgi:predicted nucleic acid-binding protein
VIIADTSLIACLAIRNEDAELAGAVCAADPVWAAPVLWRSEFRHALVKCIQRAGMSLDEAMRALQSAEEIMAGREYQVSSGRVLELAARSKCTGFDCEYVALAQDLDVPLVTADPQILKAFPKTAVSLEKFARKK